jgi:hypothetical protein
VSTITTRSSSSSRFPADGITDEVNDELLPGPPVARGARRLSSLSAQQGDVAANRAETVALAWYTANGVSRELGEDVPAVSSRMP